MKKGPYVAAAIVGLPLGFGLRAIGPRNESEQHTSACRTAVAAAMTDTESQEWQALYARASPEELRTEIDALQQYLHEITASYYASQFEAGNGVIVGHRQPGEPFSPEPTDGLCAWRFLPSGEVDEVKLPVEGFEEAYALQRKIAWLLAREDDPDFR